MPAKDTPLEKLGSPLATNGQGQKKLAELPADDVHQEKSGSPIAVTPGVHDKIGSSGGPHLCAGELEARDERSLGHDLGKKNVRV